MLKGENIICVSFSYWQGHWCSRQYLMNEFAKMGNRVLCLNSPTFFAQFLFYKFLPASARPASVRYIKEARIKLFERVNENIYTYTPIKIFPEFGNIITRIPFLKSLRLLSLLLHKGNTMIIRKCIKNLTKSLKFNKPILWIGFAPEWAEHLIGHLNEKLVVYHCTDEISIFPGDHSYGKFLEERVISKSDIVFAVSNDICKDKKEINSSTYFIPNAADVFHIVNFNEDVPFDLKSIPQPLIGYCGSLWDFKIDTDLIRYTASQKPEWSIVLIGPIDQLSRQGLAKLKPIQNIYFLGYKPRSILPGYLKNSGVALMPFKIGKYTQGAFPLKFFEYLAAGLPIVATYLPELKPYEKYVKLAKTKEEFVEFIEIALTEKDKYLNERIELAKKNSWIERAEKMAELMKEQMKAKHKSNRESCRSL